MTDVAVPSVADSWHRIDAWLAAHAPASLALLNPPAAAEDVRRAESVIGLGLPADLTGSLSVHDGLSGWGSPLPAAAPLSATRIAESWRIRTAEYDPDDYDDEDDDDGERWWNPLWIPWAETAGGDLHVIDLRPGPGHGRVGTAVHDDGGDFTRAWPTLSAHLAAVAHALWHGGGVAGLFPHLTADGTVRWSRPADE